jgi:hypothetical protein
LLYIPLVTTAVISVSHIFDCLFLIKMAKLNKRLVPNPHVGARSAKKQTLKSNPLKAEDRHYYVCMCASLSPKDRQHPSFFLISRRISLFLFRFLVTHRGAKRAKYALSAFSPAAAVFCSVRLLQLEKYDRITQCADLYTHAHYSCCCCR